VSLPASTTTLSGSGTDADGTIASYSWTKVSGPGATIADPSSPSTSVSGLVEGSYVFRLTVSDNEGLIGFDDVSLVVTPAPPPAGTRYVKVNVFGGTNPYLNGEWNNWNVSSSLNSGALKYSDATTSSISATLSRNNGVSDNGSTYGGTMAPPEVLRYVSYSTAARTITLSGLSANKTYSLELYGSKNATGYSTIYTVNGTSVTILTDRNKTNVATFTNLVPSASGQVIVSLSATNTYNYINGFVLTEVDNVQTTTITSAGMSASGEGLALSVVADRPSRGDKLMLSAYPNPARHQFTLQARGAGVDGALLQLRVIDGTGKVVEERHNLVGSSLIRLGEGYGPGTYYAELIQGSAKTTTKLVKLP
jgi:hypothetical protein